MIESGAIFTFFDKILNCIGLIREEKKRRTAQIDNALLAVYAALAETKPYIEDRRNGKRRSRKRELEIARLWHSASVPLRSIDKKFAERCFLKGSYWLEPDTWNKRKIEEKGIAIDTVFNEIRQLLIR